MTPMPSQKPDLKVAPEPTGLRGRESADSTTSPAPAKRSLASRLTRGFFQLLLPVLVLAGAAAAYQYLKATKPEPPKRQAKPNIFSVNAVPVAFATIRPELRLFGTTVAGRRVEMRSLVAGQVAATSDHLRDGGKISAGEMILSIEPFNFASAIEEAEAQTNETLAKIKEFEASLVVERGNLKFAREQVELAEIDLSRAEPLSRRGAVTERVVDERRLVLNQRRQAVSQMENNIQVWQARIAQQKAVIKRLDTVRRVAAQRLSETRLVAPFNAYVTEVGAQVGRLLGVNDRVATLIDRDWIEVAFTVTDRQFGRLAVGGESIEGRNVEVRWNVGDKPLVYQAKIDRVGASVSSEAGGVQLYARVRDPAAGVGLRPGAFVEVRVPDTEFSDVARLPSTAIFNGDTVYLIKDGKLASRKVTVVATSGADVLLRGDLKSGDRIMTTRLSLPGDGVRVREVTAANGKPAAGDARAGTAAGPPSGKSGGKPGMRPDGKAKAGSQ